MHAIFHSLRSFFTSGVKLSCVNKYRLRLRERDRRKRVARSHALISTSIIPNRTSKTPTPKRKFVKEDKEFVDKMKAFTQFQTSADVDRLQEGLLSESRVIKISSSVVIIVVVAVIHRHHHYQHVYSLQ
jgi:hypothetical protein